MAVGVAALCALALATSAPDQALDPEDTGPAGGKAWSRCCATTASRSQVVRSIDELDGAGTGSGTTVVVGNPAYLGADSSEVLRARRPARADRLVLVSPTAEPAGRPRPAARPPATSARR